MLKRTILSIGMFVFLSLPLHAKTLTPVEMTTLQGGGCNEWCVGGFGCPLVSGQCGGWLLCYDISCGVGESVKPTSSRQCSGEESGKNCAEGDREVLVSGCKKYCKPSAEAGCSCSVRKEGGWIGTLHDCWYE